MSGKEVRWVVFGALLGLSTVALIEAFNNPPLSVAQTVALFCFAVAIPAAGTNLLIEISPGPGEKIVYQHEGLAIFVETILGILSIAPPIVGLGALFWHHLKAAGLVFIGAVGVSFLCFLLYTQAAEIKEDEEQEQPEP